MRPGKLSRVARTHIPVPRVWTWRVTLAVLGAILLAAIWWAGGKMPDSQPWASMPLLAWLGRFFEGLTGFLTGHAGSDNIALSARLLALAMALGFVLVLRREMIASLGHKPGSVQVQDFADRPADQGMPSPAQRDALLAQLREELCQTHLYPPESLHSEVPPAGFLDLLGDVDPAPDKLGASLLRLLGRLRPKIAYRVSPVLQVRSTAPRFGVTVTVTAYLTGGSSIDTLWGTSWEEAIRKAGFWVIATLLPVTRACAMPPWRDWRNREMPYELFAAYQEAKNSSRQERFDTAMSRYHDALRLDPLNPYVRFELGKVQERLGLFIDALDSYHGAMSATWRDIKKENDRLWQPWWRGRGPHFIIQQWRRPGYIDIRHSYARCLTAQAARQWCKPDGSEPRDRERAEIRRRLTKVFEERYPELGLQAMRTANSYLEARSEVPPKVQLGVQLLFEQASSQEMSRLTGDRLLMPRRRGCTRTWTSLRICRNVLYPIRLAATERQLAERKGLSRAPGHGRPQKGAARWTEDLTQEKLKKRVDAILGWRLGHGEWQDHYNAACAYAIAMQPDAIRLIRGSRAEDLARLACRELWLAATSADSAFTTVTTSKQWAVLLEDPDLSELRGNEHFWALVRRLYPAGDWNPATVRKEDPAIVMSEEMTVYYQAILQDSAQVMEETWHHRAEPTRIDIHLAGQWFVDEEQIWKLIRRFAKDRGRSWRTRVALLDAVSRAADATALARADFPPPLRHLGYVPEDAPAEPGAKAKATDARLKQLAEVLALNGDDAMLDHVRAWQGAIRLADSHGVTSLPPTVLNEVCERWAAAWQGLRDSLQHPPTAEARADDGDWPAGFTRAIRRIPPPDVHKSKDRNLDRIPAQVTKG